MIRQSEIRPDVQWLGRRPYADVWELQKRLLEQRIEGAIGDTLLLVEHEPVYTWGKRTDPEHLGAGEAALRALGADTFQVERGGEVTWHGPGQLTGYPICNLTGLSCGRDLHKYMRGLEEMIIRVLASYGLQGERIDGLTGVWARSAGASPAQAGAPRPGTGQSCRPRGARAQVVHHARLRAERDGRVPALVSAHHTLRHPRPRRNQPAEPAAPRTRHGRRV
ncbi:MAG: hypothetical protein M5U25_12040 [Planctomycetota bacterium]|nr:hypothetical protein [Planctomycetota bacterium]